MIVSVSIHKLHTVPLWYGEPFALMVNPTWLLHCGHRFESLLNTGLLAGIYHSLWGTYVLIGAPLLVPSMGGLGGMLDRLGRALLPPVSMIQYYSTYTRVPGSVSIHKLRTVPLWYGELLAQWFILHGCSTGSWVQDLSCSWSCPIDLLRRKFPYSCLPRGSS